MQPEPPLLAPDNAPDEATDDAPLLIPPGPPPPDELAPLLPESDDDPELSNPVNTTACGEVTEQQW